MRIVDYIKKFWKGITCVVVLLAVTGGYLAYVTAADSTTVTIVIPYDMDTSNLLYQHEYDLQANVTNMDVPADVLNGNLHWVSSDANIVTFCIPGSSNTVPTIGGQRNVQIKAVAAGQTEIKAIYYYYPNHLDQVVDLNDTNPPEPYQMVESRPLKLKTNLIIEDVEPMIVENKVYDGIETKFQTNTNQVIGGDGTALGDPILVRNSIPLDEKYIAINHIDPAHATVNVRGGGVFNVIVSTEKGYQGNNQYVPGLSQAYVIYNKVHFTDHRISDGTLIVTQDMYNSADLLTINSNIAPNSQVTASSTNNTVATFDPNSGRLGLVGAGVTKITAGILDEEGLWMEYTDPISYVSTSSEDSVDVVVPLMVKAGDGSYQKEITVSMGVGDHYNIELNVPAGAAVNYPIQDVNTDVAYADNGVIYPVGPGETTITAKYNMGAGYESEGEVKIHVEVSDTFTLSSAAHDMDIGQSYDLQVFTSSNAPVTFTVNGVVIENGKTPEGLTCLVDGMNKKLLHMTAVEPGEYKVIATQIVDGIVKTASATVNVRTGVDQIRINPNPLTIKIGDSATLYAIVGPDDAYNKEIVWVSSDESKAVVEKTSTYEALVTGVDGGIVTIFAVSSVNGEVQGTCTVTVTKSVEGLSLNATDVTVDMTLTPTYQLLATVEPVNAPGANDGIDRTVIWESSNTKVATIDQNGLVTFVHPGAAAIVAKTADGAYIATCNFTVVEPVEKVEITSDNIRDMLVGQSISLTAEVLPLTASNRTVSWTSTDTNVCTIDSNGKLTAKGPGDTVIWCSSILDGNINDYILVHVIEPVDGVVLNLSETTVRKDTEFWLFATVFPATAEYKDVEWSSSDTDIATVDEHGKVTTIQPGTTTITALNPHSGNSASCVVTVTESVTGIVLKTGDSETMFVGAKYTIIPEIEPIDAQDKSVTYYCTDTAIATVDDMGVVTALKGGECDIIVTTNDRQLSTKCHITVYEYVGTVTLDRTFDYVNIGKSKQLQVSVTTESASNKNIIWKSADSSIASVDSEGVVTGNKIGTTVITAAAQDGGGAVSTCVIQVVEPVTEITFEDSVLNLFKGDTHLISVSVSPDTATVKALKWESNAPSVATVDEDGEVTAVGVGKAKITATSTDGNNVTATCTVYVKDTINATTITLTPTNLSLKTGESRNLTVRTAPTTITESIAWITSNPTVVTVDGIGKVTAVGEGEAEIIAYGRASGVQAVCKVTVENPVNKATSLRLNTNQMILLTGQSRPIQYRLLPTNSVERINWISSDFAVATVNSDGVVTTTGPGQCTIIAQTSLGGIETTCTVYSMAMSKTSMTLQQYDPFTLYVDGAPEGAAISWRTGNARIATVSATGEVIGRKEGTTTITATIEDKTLTCIVKIVSATKD